MLYVPQLTEAKKAELELLVRTGSPRLARRARVVLLSADGKTVPEIADKVDLHHQNVRKWIHRYRREGACGLLHRATGQSRNVKHNPATKRRIAEIAGADPRTLGLTFERWSLPRLRDYLVEQQVVSSICVESIRKILRSHNVEWRKNRRPHAMPGTPAEGSHGTTGRIGIHFTRTGRIAISDPASSDPPTGMELVSEHHQKNASDIQLLHDPETRAITVRFFRRASGKTGKEG